MIAPFCRYPSFHFISLSTQAPIQIHLLVMHFQTSLAMALLAASLTAAKTIGDADKICAAGARVRSSSLACCTPALTGFLDFPRICLDTKNLGKFSPQAHCFRNIGRLTFLCRKRECRRSGSLFGYRDVDVLSVRQNSE